VLEIAMSQFRPHVLIIEHSKDNTFSVGAIKEIRQKYPETKMVILSNQTDPLEVKKVINLGITTYLFRNCSEQEIFNALKNSTMGQKFFCAKTIDILLDEQISIPQHTEIELISEREKEIILLLASGKRPKEIANTLHISPNTVNTHKKNIYRKLGVNSSFELGKFAIKNLISV
jgi:DNA-binding NarL/FixJ family response regulator